MSTVVWSSSPMRAADQSCIRSSAPKIIKPNRSWAIIKPTHAIHWIQGTTGGKYCASLVPSTGACSVRVGPGEAQLFASHIGICLVKVVITNGTPLSIDIDLKSSRWECPISNCSPDQPQVTIPWFFNGQSSKELILYHTHKTVHIEWHITWTGYAVPISNQHPSASKTILFSLTYELTHSVQQGWAGGVGMKFIWYWSSWACVNVTPIWSYDIVWCAELIKQGGAL